MTRTLFTALALLVSTSITYAQPMRQIPGQSSDVFTEVAEVAPGNYQVLLLKAVEIVGQEGVQPDDVFIYHKDTGWALLVRNISYPFGGTPLPYDPFKECFQYAKLRPGVVWSVGALDRDGRSDLIGHDPNGIDPATGVRGQIVRLYQRKSAYDCTY